MKQTDTPPPGWTKKKWSWKGSTLRKVVRVVMHIPHGWAFSWMVLWSEEPFKRLIANPPPHWCVVVTACVFLTVFVGYEIVEDWRIKDHAYVDLMGLQAGLLVTALGPLAYLEWWGV
jgi:purine-cytosine permease-like protein